MSDSQGGLSAGSPHCSALYSSTHPPRPVLGVRIMKLGFLLGYSGKHIHIPIDLIKQAESMGYDSVGPPRPTATTPSPRQPMYWRRPPRSAWAPPSCKCPAHTRDVCDDRHVTRSTVGRPLYCRLGRSGPQVVEGWHGVPTASLSRAPKSTSRSCARFSSEGPVEFDGQMYQMPNQSEGTTGLGKPLKSILAAASTSPFTPLPLPRRACAAPARW